MCSNCQGWEPEPEPIKPGDLKGPERPSTLRGGLIKSRPDVSRLRATVPTDTEPGGDQDE